MQLFESINDIILQRDALRGVLAGVDYYVHHEQDMPIDLLRSRLVAYGLMDLSLKLTPLGLQALGHVALPASS